MKKNNKSTVPEMFKFSKMCRGTNTQCTLINAAVLRRCDGNPSPSRGKLREKVKIAKLYTECDGGEELAVMDGDGGERKGGRQRP